MASLIDTNLLVRFLTGDDIIKAKKVRDLLRNPTERFIITEIVVAEVVWVLTSVYEVSKEDIVPQLLALISYESIVCNKELISAVLNTWNYENIDFIDAYLIVFAGEIGVDRIYSYDKKIAKAADIVEVIEP